MVIDDEMLSNVLRAVRGIEINDEALDISVIRDVVRLGHDQTIAAMERVGRQNDPRRLGNKAA